MQNPKLNMVKKGLAKRVKDFSDKRIDAIDKSMQETDESFRKEIEFPNALKPSEIYDAFKSAGKTLFGTTKMIGWGLTSNIAKALIRDYAEKSNSSEDYAGLGKKEKRVISEIQEILKKAHMDSASIEDSDSKGIKKLITMYAGTAERAETAAHEAKSQKSSDYLHNLAAGSFNEAEYFSNKVEDYEASRQFKNSSKENLQNIKGSEKGKRLEGKLSSIIGISALTFSLIFFSPTLTGNVIANLTTKTSSLIGAGLFIIGIIGSYFWFKNK